MKFKQNVTVTFTKTNLHILKCVEQAFREELLIEPICTSGLEGTHSPESGHYHGRALDFRNPPAFVNGENLVRLKTRIEELLAKGDGTYYVLFESDHIHVQRNKGEV